MSDLIRREDAIKAIHREARIAGGSVAIEYADMFQDAIEAVPSADRPQGRWMDKTIPVSKANPYGGIIVGTVCPICGYDGEDEKLGRISYRIVERFNFCPNCGADMRGADDE